jgi:hypothetical protein
MAEENFISGTRTAIITSVEVQETFGCLAQRRKTIMTIRIYREGESADSGLAMLDFGRLWASKNVVVMSHSEPRGFGKSRHEIRIDADSFADLAQQ